MGYDNLETQILCRGILDLQNIEQAYLSRRELIMTRPSKPVQVFNLVRPGDTQFSMSSNNALSFAMSYMICGTESQSIQNEYCIDVTGTCMTLVQHVAHTKIQSCLKNKNQMPQIFAFGEVLRVKHWSLHCESHSH